MILIIGGLASGKRQYVKSYYGYSEDDMADAVLDSRPIIYNLQNLVQADINKTMALLPELLKKEIIICNETGSGLVPLDKNERQIRDNTGNLLISLAKEAEKVVRIICGIPTVIKE